MQGFGEQIVTRRKFGDLTEIHHRDTVGDVADHRKVMADEQIGQAKLFLQILQQIDHLRLDRHIQCRNWFITHDETRIEGKGAGNADALTLSA